MTHLPQWIRTRLWAVLKNGAKALGIVVIVLLAFRIYKSQTGPALQPWHTWTANEMSAREVDRANFADYLARETAIFHDLQTDVTDTLQGNEKTPLNRYYRNSPVWSGRFPDEGNRSFVLMPGAKPKGVVVLLHGLTDSPYSVKSLASDYQQQGFIAIAPRLPGHGTAPGALTDVDWQDWMAVTCLAVREATRLAGKDVPLHLVGYSNGGALAMKYALDALDDPQLRQPQQLILLSPMIRVNAFARFAGLAGLPALLPPAPRRFTTTVVTNASAQSLVTVARTTRAGERDENVQPLAMSYPRDLYSLSHVAIPFPPDDDLYGSQPIDPQRYGINLGNVSLRGETSTLVVGMDSLMRVTSNPFYNYMVERINQLSGCAESCQSAASKAAPAR